MNLPQKTFIYTWWYMHISIIQAVVQEFEKLKVLEYEKTTVQLVNQMFFDSKQLITKEVQGRENAAFMVYASAGTYGNLKRRVEQRLSKDGKVTLVTKVRYCFSRLFPSKREMQSKFLICKRYPIVIPFAYIYRLTIRAVQKLHCGRIQRELRILRDIK